jgi:hypothetical protein
MGPTSRHCEAGKHFGGILLCGEWKRKEKKGDGKTRCGGHVKAPIHFWIWTGFKKVKLD